jgi:hypothetical protein
MTSRFKPSFRHLHVAVDGRRGRSYGWRGRSYGSRVCSHVARGPSLAAFATNLAFISKASLESHGSSP